MDIKMVCSKCGKQPPINKDKSNKNWTVYDTSKPCACGGKWKVKL